MLQQGAPNVSYNSPKNVVSEKDFDRICRTCLGVENLTRIFTTTIHNVRVTDLLKNTVTILIKENDSMPPNICEGCLSDLHRLYEFKKRCHENEYFLRSVLRKPKVEENVYKLEEDFSCDYAPVKEENELGEVGPIESLLEVKTEFKMEIEPLRPFQCDSCPRAFRLKDYLRRHKKLHSGERRYGCSKCCMSFIRVDSRNKHEKTHLKQATTRYTCTICGHSYKHLTLYQKHLQKHNSQDGTLSNRNKPQLRPFVCDICQHTFFNKYGLDQHLLTHGEKPFLCNVCGKSFLKKHGLEEHLRIHTKEKPFICVFCKKSFAYVGSLKTHVKTHTGEKPYSCKDCLKSFSCREHLKRHVRIHTGEKPYNCSFCGKNFAGKSNLTIHLRLHSGERPYVCSICGKGFADLSGFKKHMRRNHKEENEQKDEDKIKLEA